MEMGQWVMGHCRWPIGPWWWYNCAVTGQCCYWTRKMAHFLWVCQCKNFFYTRKLCYRKDDRTMRLTYGCPENCWYSWLRPRPLFPTFSWLLFRSTLWMFLQNFRSVALPVPEIIGGTQKIWQSLDTPTLPFFKKFLMGFFSDRPWKYAC